VAKSQRAWRRDCESGEGASSLRKWWWNIHTMGKGTEGVAKVYAQQDNIIFQNAKKQRDKPMPIGARGLYAHAHGPTAPA